MKSKYRYNLLLYSVTTLVLLLLSASPVLASEIQGPVYMRQLTVFAEKQHEARNAVIEHRVVRGETLGIIAAKHNTTVPRIMADNGLVNSNFVREGWVLYIVKGDITVSQAAHNSGVVHKLVRGETVWDLALRYGVDMNNIIAANNINDPHRLRAGQEIIIPGAGFAAVKTVATSKNDLMIASRTVARTSSFTWPVQGRVSSGYGPRWGKFHHGIDIAAKTGTTIAAVAAGTVIEAGWRTGYGYMVRINHHDGWESLYAHASNVYVKNGQVVQKGERIAAVGQTGNATGPHLHLEMILEGTHKNPIKYLP